MIHCRHIPVLLFWAVSAFSEEELSYHFQTADLKTLENIVNYSVAPNGRINERRPAAQVFAERKRLTQHQLVDSILRFSDEQSEKEQYATAAQALGYLSGLRETNSVPYLVHFVMDERHSDCIQSPLYALLLKNPCLWGHAVQEILEKNSMSPVDRVYLYMGVHGCCRAETRYNHRTSPEWLESVVKTIQGLLTIESKDSPRWNLDHILCDFKDGWKFSNERISVLREWAKTRESTEPLYDWFRIADETEKAIRSGKTDWTLYKNRPRPPQPPRNPDGSLAVPKGQELFINLDDGIPQELKDAERDYDLNIKHSSADSSDVQ